MAIFRGEGGAGASDTNATVSLVTQQAVIATTKASVAASHATDASTHADTATAQATAAANSVAVAANISTGVQTYSDAAVASAALAVTAKTNAETAETNAETAESNASTHATTATTKASEAVTSASSASTSASSASSSASTASTHATNAATSASTSSTQATNAAASATSAETAKTNAETAKTNAETAETNAASSATAASISATSVATSATNATTQATAAAASAATASTVASTALDTYRSATPTLSSSVTNKIVIGNYSSYVNPIFIVKVGSTVIPNINNAGTLTLTVPNSLSGTQTVSVEVFDVGKLYSASATVSLEFSALFARYWRITGLVQATHAAPAFYQWFLFPNTGGSGTKMGSASAITVSYNHSSYNPQNMYVGTSSIAWYLRSFTGTLASHWAQYDLGSAQEVNSMLVNTYLHYYHSSSITIQNSNDGINFTDIKTVTQSSDTNNWTFDL
tara:strand:- start:248 stop:1618 length:1371 start_codon:yes stop_codon:yes gene_type:complete